MVAILCMKLRLIKITEQLEKGLWGDSTSKSVGSSASYYMIF